MHQVTLEEASHQLAELFEEASRGEEVVIRNNGFAVKLMPVEAKKRRPQLGTAAGQVWIADDFDAPLEDFKDYM
jgi:prevent-host-death family protein